MFDIMVRLGTLKVSVNSVVVGIWLYKSILAKVRSLNNLLFAKPPNLS